MLAIDDVAVHARIGRGHGSKRAENNQDRSYKGLHWFGSLLVDNSHLGVSC
jgi:hypothetical protein